MRRAHLLAAFALALEAFTVPARAQDAPDITFALRMVGDRQQFRPGELIQVELIFSSPVRDRFVVSGATYDRSGRLAIDDWHIEPFEGFADPLLDFYAGNTGGIIGGGLSSMNPLGDGPVRITLALNAWFRFDRPGEYTLRARTRRVTDEAARDPAGRPAIVPLESTPVSFEILPRDSEWEAIELAHAVRLMTQDDRSLRRDGCRVLRYLATTNAVDEMLRRLHGDPGGCGFDHMAGLFTVRDRAFVVRRMEERLTAADQPVGATYLRTLAILSLYQQHPELLPAQTPDTVGRIVRGELAQRPDLVDAAVERYAMLALASLPSKAPGVRALSLAEVLGILSPGRGKPVSPALREQLAEAFADLPLARQRALLEWEWDRYGGKAFLPALRAIVTAPRASSSPAFDAALRRLHDLAPDEARPLILREIRDPRPGVTIATLGVLPDRELPAFDEQFLARGGATDLDAQLIQRYASPAIAPRLVDELRGSIGRRACRPQAALLAYVLRAAPASGRALIEQALASRSESACYQTLLGDVARFEHSPVIEALAIVHLDDRAPRVVMDAADTLRRHGSAKALPPLRARFARWSDTWAGRADDLRLTHTRDNPAAVEAMVENVLLQALAEGLGWLATEATLRELSGYCVTENCRREAARLEEASRDRQIHISPRSGDPAWSIRVAQYHLDSLDGLERKLAQYPAGTEFTLHVAAMPAAQAGVVSARIIAAAARGGVVVKR